MGDFALALLSIIIFLCGLMLILLILVQRGRGGGLVGALGGGGSASPFGSRAGDTFTRYTIVLALVWIALNMIQTLAIQPNPVPRQANAIGPVDGGGGPPMPVNSAPAATPTAPTAATVPTLSTATAPAPANTTPTAPK